MIEKIRKLIIKYKELVLYVIFGALTCIISIVCYDSLNKSSLHVILGMTPEKFAAVSNIISWIVAVAFAFVTNKLFVFESKSFVPKIFWPELLKFSGGRVATGLLSEGIILLFVAWLKQDPLLWKVISTIIEIVFNFVISKLLVFKKKK